MNSFIKKFGTLVLGVLIITTSCTKKKITASFNTVKSNGYLSYHNNNETKSIAEIVEEQEIVVQQMNNEILFTSTNESTESIVVSNRQEIVSKGMKKVDAKNSLPTLISTKNEARHLKKEKKVDHTLPEKYSAFIAFLLCFFLGWLGVHRFYMGYKLIGIIQLLTLGGLIVWWFIDINRIIKGKLRQKI